MDILLISRWCPCPPDNGSKIRIFNLLRQLAKHHRVTLLAFVQEPVSAHSLAYLQSCCHSVQLVPYRDFNPRGLRSWVGALSVKPRSMVAYSSEMKNAVQRVSAQSSFDVVVAYELESTPYALLVKQTPRVFENVELAVLYEKFARQAHLASKVRFGLTWWKLSRFLTRLLGHYHGVTTVSSHEYELVSRLLPDTVRAAVIPNGVDLEWNSGDWGMPEPHTLIYPGALTFDANFDAVGFALRDIWPLVQAGDPQVTMRITGRYDGVPVERLPLGPAITLTGYVEDIRPEVARSEVCVVPLRIGGGTRLKILQAMALGTPVVSTSKGAEGLEVVSGEHILIADEPAAFAGAVLRLLGDRDLRMRLGGNGRRLMCGKYGWELIGHQLDQFLDTVVQEYRSHVASQPPR